MRRSWRINPYKHIYLYSKFIYRKKNKESRKAGKGGRV
jgi:hypothetical protein